MSSAIEVISSQHCMFPSPFQCIVSHVSWQDTEEDFNLLLWSQFDSVSD